MPDDNADTCCAMEVCCGGPQSKAKEAFAEWLHDNANLNKGLAAQVSEVVLTQFALAPREFAAVAEAIGKLAREHAEYNA